MAQKKVISDSGFENNFFECNSGSQKRAQVLGQKIERALGIRIALKRHQEDQKTKGFFHTSRMYIAFIELFFYAVGAYMALILPPRNGARSSE